LHYLQLYNKVINLFQFIVYNFLNKKKNFLNYFFFIILG
jgi:hypothetical protein